MGVGASFAINIVDNDTTASIGMNATVSNATDVTLSATGSHEATTTASGGGSVAG